MYRELQEKVYENKVKRNFNVSEVNKEITLMTEEFGELCDAYINGNHSEIADAVGDIMIYCLGLTAMFKADSDEIINNKNSLLGAIRRPKPAVLRSSLNREFLELKTVGLKSGVLNPPVFNKDVEQPKEPESLRDYFPYIGRELGMVAKTYKKSNKKTVDEIDERDEFLKYLGNLMGYCSQIFQHLKVSEMEILEQIIYNNTIRTHQGKI